MILSRRVVQLAHKFYLVKGELPTNRELMDYTLEDKRILFWHYSWDKEKIKRRLAIVMSVGLDKYVVREKDKVIVNKEGLKFITLAGFVEEWLSEHSKIVAGILGGGGVALIWLVTYIINHFKQ